MQKFGYIIRDGKEMPDANVAKTVRVRVVLEEAELLSTLRLTQGKNGQEWAGPCPFGQQHGRDKCFSINDATGLFHCHACKRSGGNVLDFLMKLRNCGLPKAAEWLVAIAERLQGDRDSAETLHTNDVVAEAEQIVAEAREDMQDTDMDKSPHPDLALNGHEAKSSDLSDFDQGLCAAFSLQYAGVITDLVMAARDPDALVLRIAQSIIAMADVREQARASTYPCNG